MVRMQLQRILGFSAALALATAVVAGLSAIRSGAEPGTVGWQIISRFVVVQVYGFFGLFMARDSGIPGALFVGTSDWADNVRGIVNWGILPGLIIGVINYLFFFAYRYSPFVIPRIRDMKSGYDAFILSLESGITEESIYRLFILSSIFYLLRRLYARVKPSWPGAVKFLPPAWRWYCHHWCSELLTIHTDSLPRSSAGCCLVEFISGMESKAPLPPILRRTSCFSRHHICFEDQL